MKTYLSLPQSIYDNASYFDELPFWSAPFGIELLDTIHYVPVRTALDIGSGTGFPVIELAMRLGSNARVYGVDPWRTAVSRAQQKAAYHRLSNVVFMQSVAEDLPVRSESIDLITSNNGINNVQDRKRVITECARVLRQGGQFVATMNTAASMLEFYRYFETVLQEMHLDTAVDAMHAHIEEKRPDVGVVCAELERAGIMIKQRTMHTFNYRFANGTALLHHRFIMGAFLPSWVRLVPTASAEVVFDRIEQLLNDAAKRQGGFMLTIPFVVIDAERCN